jgi:hypothetical protein
LRSLHEPRWPLPSHLRGCGYVNVTQVPPLPQLPPLRADPDALAISAQSPKNRHRRPLGRLRPRLLRRTRHRSAARRIARHRLSQHPRRARLWRRSRRARAGGTPAARDRRPKASDGPARSSRPLGQPPLQPTASLLLTRFSGHSLRRGYRSTHPAKWHMLDAALAHRVPYRVRWRATWRQIYLVELVRWAILVS